MPGAHKIGAAISGPRITGEILWTPRFFLKERRVRMCVCLLTSLKSRHELVPAQRRFTDWAMLLVKQCKMCQRMTCAPRVSGLRAGHCGDVFPWITLKQTVWQEAHPFLFLDGHSSSLAWESDWTYTTRLEDPERMPHHLTEPPAWSVARV